MIDTLSTSWLGLTQPPTSFVNTRRSKKTDAAASRFMQPAQGGLRARPSSIEHDPEAGFRKDHGQTRKLDFDPIQSDRIKVYRARHQRYT
jgi:hypothetical protein